MSIFQSRFGEGTIRSSKWIHGHRIIGIVHSGDRDWISRGFKTHRQPANPLIWPVSDRVVSRQSPPRGPDHPKTSISRDPIHTHTHRRGSSLSMVNVWFANKLRWPNLCPTRFWFSAVRPRFNPFDDEWNRSKPSNTLHCAILIYIYMCVCWWVVVYTERICLIVLILDGVMMQRVCVNGISLSFLKNFNQHVLSEIDELSLKIVVSIVIYKIWNLFINSK